jgi:hypothetical protein
MDERGIFLTSRLLSQAIAHLTLVLEVDVPALGLTGAVLQRKCENSVSKLDGLLLIRLAGSQGLVDGIKGNRGRELVWKQSISARLLPSRRQLGCTREYRS